MPVKKVWGKAPGTALLIGEGYDRKNVFHNVCQTRGGVNKDRVEWSGFTFFAPIKRIPSYYRNMQLGATDLDSYIAALSKYLGIRPFTTSETDEAVILAEKEAWVADVLKSNIHRIAFVLRGAEYQETEVAYFNNDVMGREGVIDDNFITLNKCTITNVTFPVYQGGKNGDCLAILWKSSPFMVTVAPISAAAAISAKSIPIPNVVVGKIEDNKSEIYCI